MTLTDTSTTRIGEATLAEFAAGLRGTAVRPGDDDYDAASAASGTAPTTGVPRSSRAAPAWPT